MKAAILGVLLALLCTACGVAPQPESIRIVAAFDVPLPSAADRKAFLAVLRREAAMAGFHLDAATEEDLRTLSQVSPLTINAEIWRGENDVESLASVMNPPTEPGRTWIWFSLGEDPQLSSAFRQRLMRAVVRRWPETLSLPITPTGGIPNPEDMERTPSGYVLKPSERWRYEEPKAPPAAPR